MGLRGKRGKNGGERDESGVYSSVRLESEMFGGRVIFLRRSSTARLADSTISWRECISLCVYVYACVRVEVQENKLAHVREMIHLRAFVRSRCKKD